MDKTHLILSFAHRGEAQSFLKELPFKSIAQDHYQWEDGSIKRSLIITGEGLENTTLKLAKTLGGQSADHLINLGICGHIPRAGEEFSIGQVVQVRTTMKAESTNDLVFKSYTTSPSIKLQLPQVDLISTVSRVLDKKIHTKFNPFASLVDREAWAIGLVADHYQTPFSVIKVISDFADGEFCQMVKDDALIWSDSLLREYLKWEAILLDQEKESDENFTLDFPELYLTVSQERTLSNLLKALRLKGREISSLKEETNYNDICSQKIHPKKKSKIFLENLKDILNPLEKDLRDRLSQQTKLLSQAGFQVRFDQGFEKEVLHLNISLENEEEYKRAIKALEQYDFKKFQKTIRGDLLV